MLFVYLKSFLVSVQSYLTSTFVTKVTTPPEITMCVFPNFQSKGFLFYSILHLFTCEIFSNGIPSICS